MTALDDNLKKAEAWLERFRREYEVGSLLVHPHLAQVLDYGEDPEAGPYLVMEYYDGHPIGQRSYPEAEIVRVGLQLAHALTALVPHGLVHRDLTPANVLVDEHGLAHLIDFGLMADPAAATAAGTPLYMAPEALEGRPTDARADLYSLGALLYRMACGYAPFEGLPQAEWRAAARAAEEADVVLLVGTSATVYPAAELPAIAARGGALIVQINPAPTPLDRIAHNLRGPAGEILPKLVEAAWPARADANSR